VRQSAVEIINLPVLRVGARRACAPGSPCARSVSMPFGIEVTEILPRANIGQHRDASMTANTVGCCEMALPSTLAVFEFRPFAC